MSNKQEETSPLPDWMKALPLRDPYSQLQADHARCVQDARRMAEMAKAHRRQYWDQMADFADDPRMTDGEIAKLDPLFANAQRVMETWKEGA